MARPKVNEELKRETISIRLPRYLLDELYRCDDSAGRVVEEALIKHLSIGKKNPQPRGRTEDLSKEKRKNESKQY